LHWRRKFWKFFFKCWRTELVLKKFWQNLHICLVWNWFL
jgi:hypothetical protein